MTPDRETVYKLNKFSKADSEPEGTRRTLIYMGFSEIMGGSFNLDGKRLRLSFGVAVEHNCYLRHH